MRHNSNNAQNPNPTPTTTTRIKNPRKNQQNKLQKRQGHPPPHHPAQPHGMVTNYTHITTSERHSCAIATDETIKCWGWNEFGQTDAPAGIAHFRRP
ncbi:MAG: RCC1 domain-containing protein [Acidimicrobiaceae bacterium]|nr:RCC1 domain-containing protein [Acidimicrobiaceae bacterium]